MQDTCISRIDSGRFVPYRLLAEAQAKYHYGEEEGSYGRQEPD